MAFLVVVGAVEAASSAAPASAPAISAEEAKAGFRVLFNGKDLTGWQEVQGRPGSFVVKDGELHGNRGHRGKRTAYWLSTKEQYGDFELRLQYNIPKRGNTGVFLRAPHHGRTSKMGMEIQLLDDHGRKGAPSVGETGAIYQVVAPRERAAKPAGQWNDLHILCHGDRVRITLNGKVVTDASMADHGKLEKRPRRGHIGLSAHTDTVRFRHIRLRVIKGAAPGTAAREAE